MLRPGTDEFKLHDELQRIIIGAIFLIGMPLMIGTYANIDVLQGCSVFGDDALGKNIRVRNADGDVVVMTVNAEGGVFPAVNGCKTIISDNDNLGGLLGDVEYYLSLGVSLILAGLGFALLLGPGIKLIRH